MQNVAGEPKATVQQAGKQERDRSNSVEASGPPLVSGRWLLAAVGLSIAGAALCAWGALCLLFWQGSWQFLYHPTSAVSRTPANAGVAYEQVKFATTDTGVPRLSGWWIPAATGAPYRRFTVVFLHGQDGNLGDTVGALADLHAVGVNVLAFDYRGYGQSQFVRPSEAHWREDADWALQYLILTRHINPARIVLDGTGLGADLALEVAAENAEIAGVVMDAPINLPADAIFHDARSRMVPAHLLVKDRYDLTAAAAELRVPLLWFSPPATYSVGGGIMEPAAYQKVKSPKILVWLDGSANANRQYANALSRWLDSLQVH